MKKGGNIPFLYLTMSLVLGILLQKLIQIPISILSLLLLAALFICIFILKKGHPTLELILLLPVFLMGMVQLGLWEEPLFRLNSLQKRLPLQVDTLEMVITEIDRNEQIKCIGKMERLKLDSIQYGLDGKILVSLPPMFTHTAYPGDTLELIHPLLETIPSPRNPGEFNYQKYLYYRGILFRSHVRDSSLYRLHHRKEAKLSISRFTFASRRYLQHLIEIYFPPESSGFLQALLLGIRSHLSREVKFNFQRAGVMHVLAISGLHVGFIALSFGIILSFLPLYFKYRYPLIMLLLLFYMFLTGCQPPVVRATIMTVFFLLSRILEKPLNIYNSIFAAAFVILFFQPQQLFWVGFQFSFAAVLSIIFFYERLSPWVQLILDKCKNDWFRNRLFRWIIIPLLVSFSAQLGTVPLVMYYFHLFSPIALILNLIVIPLTGILVAGGLLFFLISFISHEVTILIADFIHQIIQLLIKLVQIPLTIPGAYLWIPRFSLIHILLYGFLLFSLIELLARRRTFIYPLMMAGILMIGNWAFREIMKTPSLQILVLDVGQGDASLILTPSGKLVCIDTGPANQYYDAARHAIIPTLQYLGKKKINYLFISHPHDDHCGGAFNLTTYAAIDSAYLPRMPMGYPMADSLKQFWETHRIPYRHLSMGDQINVDNETRIYVLSPPSQFTNYHDFDGSHVNNNSLILLIKHRDLSLLFPGDAEWPVEEALTGWKKILRANFLKVAHHGSNTSSSDAFLNLVSPSIAVISVGENNKFHHPSPRVIRRLKNHNVQIHRTDVEKALWFEWFNGKLRLKKW